MMRFLITGAAGQLGSAIVELFSRVGSVAAMKRNELDITQTSEVVRVFRDTRPDVVVNCSAYNRVDDAEHEALQALDVNAFGVLALAQAARAEGAVLIHYSTDFVFDGETSRAYTEDDPPSPQSNYGRSKLLGEWFAADAPPHYVLRVESLFGGHPAKSSVDRILDAIRQGQPARVFTDRIVTPSYVDDVAEATLKIIHTRPPTGLYHCVNSGTSTWLRLAEEAARLLSVQATLVPVEMNSVTLPAKRPRYCALSNDKLRAAGIEMPDWRDALARYVARWRQQQPVHETGSRPA